METTVYHEIHCTPALCAGDQPVCKILVVIHLREAQTGWRETDKKMKRLIRIGGKEDTMDTRPSKHLRTITYVNSKGQWQHTNSLLRSVPQHREKKCTYIPSLIQELSPVDNQLQTKNLCSPTESHWGCKPHLKTGLILNNRWPKQMNSMASLEVFFL